MGNSQKRSRKKEEAQHSSHEETGLEHTEGQTDARPANENDTDSADFPWREADVMEEAWRYVGAVSQLISRRCHRLYAESGRTFDLVLFTADNKFTAMSTWCSHMGGPLHEGDIEDYKGKKCVQCPWHGYMFDVETGVNPDIGLRQDVFETRVVSGKVYVHHPRCNLSREPFPS